MQFDKDILTERELDIFKEMKGGWTNNIGSHSYSGSG